MISQTDAATLTQTGIGLLTTAMCSTTVARNAALVELLLLLHKVRNTHNWSLWPMSPADFSAVALPPEGRKRVPYPLGFGWLWELAQGCMDAGDPSLAWAGLCQQLNAYRTFVALPIKAPQTMFEAALKSGLDAEALVLNLHASSSTYLCWLPHGAVVCVRIVKKSNRHNGQGEPCFGWKCWLAPDFPSALFPATHRNEPPDVKRISYTEARQLLGS